MKATRSPRKVLWKSYSPQRSSSAKITKELSDDDHVNARRNNLRPERRRVGERRVHLLTGSQDEGS